MNTGLPTPLNYLNAQQVTIAKETKKKKPLNTHPIEARIMGKKKRSAHHKKENHYQGSTGTI